MLSRRRVLLAGTALAVGANHSRISAASSDRETDRVEVPTASLDEIARVAESCSACTGACSDCLDVCADQIVSGNETMATLLRLCRDCSDLCAITATLLSQGGPVAPALCQACADACDRLAAACRISGVPTEVELCEQSAKHCAEACRSLIR